MTAEIHIATKMPASPYLDEPSVAELLRSKLPADRPGPLLGTALAQLSMANATASVIMGCMGGTSDEGTDRYLALWSIAETIQTASALISSVQDGLFHQETFKRRTRDAARRRLREKH